MQDDVDQSIVNFTSPEDIAVGLKKRQLMQKSKQPFDYTMRNDSS